jgi:hypothetical protein
MNETVVSWPLCKSIKYARPTFLQAQWLPKLRKVVARINDTFSRNFAEMAVAGEVALGKLTASFPGAKGFSYYNM